MENIYRDIGGFDKSYDELKNLVRRTLEEDFNSFHADRYKREAIGKMVSAVNSDQICL